MPDAPAPSPAQLERWLPPLDSSRHPRHPLQDPDAAIVWNGVVWSRLGRCDHAWQWWDALRSEQLRAWTLAERGRVLRELGLHAAARELDEAGLRCARDLTDVVMLRLSVIADDVGLGDVEAARAGLEAVEPLLEALPREDMRAGRQRLRHSWVTVEIGLLSGQRPPATGLPGRGAGAPSFPLAYDAGTDFHRAKGLLFGGVLREDPGLLRQAAALAPPMLRWACELAMVDLGVDGASQRAVEAWAAVVPPEEHRAAVEAGPTGHRIAALAR